ncbi:MAG: hypothetical protein Q8Q37_00495, partial [bacterium]|nr:hypothetical protein [bacterium]
MISKVLFFLTGTILTGGLFINQANAYGVDTHTYLTEETIQFFNRNFSDKKISSELSYYLIDGARLEDNVPRFLNHFYDPVN